MRGLVLEAPHVFVEPVCVERIAAIATEQTASALLGRLARHHGANTESMFRSWTDVWLRPEFAEWNIEELLPVIVARPSSFREERTSMGPLSQVEALATQLGGPVEALVLDRCGHAPHVDRPMEVLEAAEAVSSAAWVKIDAEGRRGARHAPTRW